MKIPAIASTLPASTCIDLQHPDAASSDLQSPTPPPGLSKDAKSWWLEIQDEYGIDDPGGLLLLKTAMLAYDRMQQARDAICKEGPTILDRFGQTKAHPLLTVERDSRAGMLQALRAMNLDVIPTRDAPGRPPGT